jgi:ribosome-associated protein
MHAGRRYANRQTTRAEQQNDLTSGTPPVDDLQVNRRLVIPASQLRFDAVTGSGPGGQRRNRVRTKVILSLNIEACEVLGPFRIARIRDRLGHRLSKAGVLSVACGRHREQARNLADARGKLASLLAAALQPVRARKRTRPTRASKRADKASKQRTSRRKDDRSWQWK